MVELYGFRSQSRDAPFIQRGARDYKPQTTALYAQRAGRLPTSGDRAGGDARNAAGLGDEPRQGLAEISRIQAVDVVMPTRDGIEIRKRCVSRPSEHQAILLHQFGLSLPPGLGVDRHVDGAKCSEDFQPKTALACSRGRFQMRTAEVGLGEGAECSVARAFGRDRHGRYSRPILCERWKVNPGTLFAPRF
jgi:hypothetical protein